MHRRDEQEVRPGTLRQTLVAIRCLYCDLLGKDWRLLHEFELHPNKPLAEHSTTSPSPSKSTSPTHRDRALGYRDYPDPLTYDHPYLCMKQFAELLALRYDCLRTRHAYYRQLNLLQRHFSCDPQTLTEEQVRDYLLFLKFEKQWKPKTIRQAVACLKCFFEGLLKQEPWEVFSQISTRDHDTVPVVLSRQQVHDLINSIRLRRYRTPIKLIYCCGLRLSECLSLTIHDIQSNEGKLRIRQGKGLKDRMVPIAQAMLEDLRVYYRFHRHHSLIFPNVGRGIQHGRQLSLRMKNASMPMPHSSLQRLLVAAREELQIPDATVHTLRHSFATHLIEKGASLHVVQRILGHKSIDTTMRYLHVTHQSQEDTLGLIENLCHGLPR